MRKNNLIGQEYRFMFNRFLSNVLHLPEWIIEKMLKWKRDIKIANLEHIAVIGDQFCYREYNNVEGAFCEIYNLNSREKVSIGKYVKLNGTIFCNKYGSISIGDYTLIGSGTVINADIEVNIGRYCFISSDVLIYDNNSHPISPKLRRAQLSNLHKEPIDNYDAVNEPIVIHDDVWIGTRSIILKGVTIGEGAIIGAGAVVTRDVPPFSIVAGNPARVVKKIAD